MNPQKVCPNCSNMLIISRAPRHPAPSTTTPAPGPPSGWTAANSSNAATTTIIEETSDDISSAPHRFECRACPYQYVLDRAYRERKRFARKKAEDVVGGKESWENVDRTQVNCADEKCAGAEAYFFQVQIRSADEPMTSFFKCVACGREWRE